MDLLTALSRFIRKGYVFQIIAYSFHLFVIVNKDVRPYVKAQLFLLNLTYLVLDVTTPNPVYYN